MMTEGGHPNGRPLAPKNGAPRGNVACTLAADADRLGILKSRTRCGQAREAAEAAQAEPGFRRQGEAESSSLIAPRPPNCYPFVVLAVRHRLQARRALALQWPDLKHDHGRVERLEVVEQLGGPAVKGTKSRGEAAAFVVRKSGAARVGRSPRRAGPG